MLITLQRSLARLRNEFLRMGLLFLGFGVAFGVTFVVMGGVEKAADSAAVWIFLPAGVIYLAIWRVGIVANDRLAASDRQRPH